MIKELDWWLYAAGHWNYREICTKSIDIQVITDASHLGWGAVCDGRIASGDWNIRVSHLSSNQREMLAILMALKAFRNVLKNKCVQVLMDNVSAMAYVNHMGGPSPSLSQLVMAI